MTILMRALVALSMMASASASVGGAAAPRAGRLPDTVIPIGYSILIDPDAKAKIFEGAETIDLNVIRPTRAITLNAADLQFREARLDGALVGSTIVDAEAQTVTFTLAKTVGAGRHSLRITWSGTINDSAAGLFAIDYADATGSRRMLATQFEPSDERRFAPAWDQPDRKATFTLSVIAPARETAFSNMPIAATKPAGNGRTTITFQSTPKMSSYLLFLGIGDVERLTTRVGQTEIGVITRRGAGDQGRYALASAARILAYYNDYFGTPYPLPKLDMIAAPGSSQFFGAMENWGAIFYFERAILLDPKLSTESDRQNVFNTVAHEMAHQWFGDLVTMDWWDDLWLNEGFASWMAGKISNDLNPAWHVAGQQVAFARQGALSTDSRSGTHPIVQHISSPAEVNQAFDTITYQKGQQVIRMLEGAVGPDAFRGGVQRYMRSHAYGNTTTDDLWIDISASSKRPIKPLMDSFTLVDGVPLIRTSDVDCTNGRARLTLSQDRFATDAASSVPRSWPVPVNLAADRRTTQVEVRGSSPHPAELNGCDTVIINPGQFGYYRTLLAPRHFAALAAKLGELPLEDQIGLLQDRIYLANAGYVPLTGALDLIDHLELNADPLLWTVIAQRIASYDFFLNGDPLQPAFRRKAIGLLEPKFRQVGFEARSGQSPAISQLREALIKTLGQLGDAQVVDGARRLVRDGLDRIPAAIRTPVTGVYARNATADEWQALLQAAKVATSPLAQQELLGELGSAQDPALAHRTLEFALTDGTSVPNRAILIAGVADEHPALAFDWAVAHADQVNALVEASSRTRFIPRLANGGSDEDLAKRVEAYATKTMSANERRATQVIVANIRYSAAVKARVRQILAAWASKAPHAGLAALQR